jgi:hypothetical protein
MGMSGLEGNEEDSPLGLSLALLEGVLVLELGSHVDCDFSL